MDRLIEFLVAAGWTYSPGILTVRLDGWTYQFVTDQSFAFVLPGGKANLVRRPFNETPALANVEFFIVEGEDRCLQVAKNLIDGNHPDSAVFDRKAGVRIGYL